MIKQIVLVITKFLQILKLYPQIFKSFTLWLNELVLTVGQNNFRNKIQILLDRQINEHELCQKKFNCLDSKSILIHFIFPFFYYSYYRNRKNSGIVDMKKLVEISSNDVSDLEARLESRFEARPPKRSKKLQNLPTENMPTPDLPTPDFTARNSPTVVSPQLPSQQYQSQHSIPVPLNGSQIYQQVSAAAATTTQHVQQPTLPGFQFIRYQNRKFFEKLYIQTLGGHCRSNVLVHALFELD